MLMKILQCFVHLYLNFFILSFESAMVSFQLLIEFTSRNIWDSYTFRDVVFIVL